MTEVDVLVPTCERPHALSVTLAGLASQTVAATRVVISDQSDRPVAGDPLVQSMVRVLHRRGTVVEVDHHRPRRGLAENRHHLLSRARSAHVLFLDDDVWLEPWAIERLLGAIEELHCGFVGFAVQGLSYLADHRPQEEAPFELWEGPVRPERLRPHEPGWERWTLHNAANPTHLGDRLALAKGDWRAYKVAWIGACVLYERQALLDAGGFTFWDRVPADHSGEDVLVQLRVMETRGGAGILPSGAVHLELPTTVERRSVECYEAVAW